MPEESGAPAASLPDWRYHPAWAYVLVILATFFWAGNATCVGFLAWNEGVRRAGPDGAMAFYNLLPVFGTLMGALFLGERMTAIQWMGGGLIILGGLLAALWAHRPALALRPT